MGGPSATREGDSKDEGAKAGAAMARGAGAGDETLRGGGAGDAAMRGAGAGDAPASAAAPAGNDALKPGAVYVLRDGKAVRVPVLTGLSDGASIEVESDQLRPGDPVIVGLEVTAQNRNLQPPPGMGGPTFRGPGGRGGGGGGGRGR